VSIHRSGDRRVGMLLVTSLVLAALLPLAPTAQAAGPGTPMTWGSNPYGQLGDGTTTSHFTPLPVTGLTDAVDVHAGRGHVVALRNSGSAVAWGQNNRGQVGNGSTANRTTPTPVTGLSSGVVDVAAGHYHSLAVRSDGTVWTWGLNATGQLGDGTTAQRTVPVQVSGLTSVVNAVGGRDMSYALRSDGTVWAWGLNSSGELGDGTTVNKSTPVRVGSLTNIVSIAAGRNHGLAIASTGTVWSWGDNQYGQLGDGTSTNRTSPVPVSGLSGVVSVAAGAHHSVALLSDGTVRTWGRNYRGALGDGTTTLRRLPVPVNGLTGVIAIGGGRDHTIAILANGTARAWGWNDFGQLGDGTTTTRTSPVAVAGLTNAVEAHGGQDHTVALTAPISPDTTPPTPPGKPVGQSPSPGTIALTWAASQDDVSSNLTYRVYRGGALAGSVTSSSITTVAFTDTGLTPGATHSYVVVAVDAALNESSPSAPSDPITVSSSPPAIFADDFSSGNFAAWSAVTRLTIDQTRGSPSVPSARAQVSGQSAFARRTITPTLGPICLSERVNLQTPGGNAVILARLQTSSAAGILRVVVNANGILQLRSDVSGTVRGSGVALGSGWVHLEVCGSVGANSSWDLYREGVRIVTDWVANTGSSAVGQIQIGDNSAKTVTMNLDDVRVDQTPG
jgi:alpha-tubulin suppressor-like RCC1 family protein